MKKEIEKDEIFERALKDITNLNINCIQKDIEKGFFRMWELGIKQGSLSKEKDVLKIIDEVSRKGDDLHNDSGKCWVYVEELKQRIKSK